MPDLLPKIADITTLKGLSYLLAMPMVCVAYTLQTGLVISFSDTIYLSVSDSDTYRITIFKIFLIFSLKSLFIAIFVHIIDVLLQVMQDDIHFPFLYLISMLLISFALLGIFGYEKIEALQRLEKFWFYAFMVWGVYFQLVSDKPINSKRRSSK